MLYLFFWLEAAALTGLFYFLFPNLHLALILPIALGLFLALCVLFVGYLMISSLFFSKEPHERPNRFAALTVRLALPWFSSFLGARVRVTGKENLPRTPVIFVCNHRSAFDPVFISAAFPRRKMAFVSKQSVAKYPFIGPYMNACAYVFIDRDSPMQSLRAIHRAAKYVRDCHIDYGIFPEGTRGKGKELLPFKGGAFLLAKKADAPIAVLSMEGTEGFVSRLPFRLPRIRLAVKGIISVEDVRAMTPDALSEKARDMMKEV